MSRDLLLEREFLDNVEREAARRFGINVCGYRGRVEQRLDIGAERYGDEDFLTKDVIHELLEETPDVGAYALLETQKRMGEPFEDDATSFHLFEAAVLAAAADWHARQTRRST